MWLCYKAKLKLANSQTIIFMKISSTLVMNVNILIHERKLEESQRVLVLISTSPFYKLIERCGENCKLQSDRQIDRPYNVYLQDGNIPLMHFTYFSPLLSNSPLTISYTNQYTAIYTIRLSPWTDEYWTFFIIEVFLFFDYHTFSISIRFFWRKLIFHSIE